MNLEAILTILITIAQITTVYLAARGNHWTWVFSIVTGLILCYNFFTDRHFMSFAFQAYSILASIGGVFIWKKKEEDNRRTICWGNPLWPLLAVIGIAAVTFLIILIIFIYLSFAAAYAAVWFEMLLGYIDTLYIKLYENLYPKETADTEDTETEVS